MPRAILITVSLFCLHLRKVTPQKYEKRGQRTIVSNIRGNAIKGSERFYIADKWGRREYLLTNYLNCAIFNPYNRLIADFYILMIIQLPNVEPNENTKAHFFPVQIGFQTLEFMNGAIFHQVLSDTAATQRVRQADAIQEIEETLLNEGLSQSALNEGWGNLSKYQDFFTKNIRQSVLITIRSHWDWYISHIGKFSEKNYSNIYNKRISSSGSKKLLQIGFKDIVNQIDTLNKILDLNLKLDKNTLDQVHEMSLVRNLGLHNRWEVDQYYIDKTKTSGWKLREIRLFEISELEQWHSALITLVNETWKPIAIQFKGAPPYKI